MNHVISTRGDMRSGREKPFLTCIEGMNIEKVSLRACPPSASAHRNDIIS